MDDRSGRNGRVQFPGNAYTDRHGSRRRRDQQVPIQSNTRFEIKR